MTKRRFILLALLIGVFAFLAAGCGGDDNEASGGATTGEGGGNVSGNISVLAVWTGAEGENFQAVLDGFTAENPDVTVSYKSAKEPATVLSTVGRGRQPARHRRPAAAGLHDGLRPARRAEADRLRGGRDQGRLFAVLARSRHRRREALRPLFQGRQQVDHLVQRARFHGRRRRAGRELGRLPGGRRHAGGLGRHALLDRRRRRLDAHRPLREHLPPRSRSRRSTTS